MNGSTSKSKLTVSGSSTLAITTTGTAVQGVGTITFGGNSSTTITAATAISSSGTTKVIDNATATINATTAISGAGNVQLSDSSQTIINAGTACPSIKTFHIGNGTISSSETCNASFTYNVVGTPQDTFNFASSGSLVINTLGSFAINGNSTSTKLTAIKFNGGACTLVVKCADMFVGGYQNVFGCWTKFDSYSTTYEYEAPYAKLKYRCTKLYSNSKIATGAKIDAFWELFSPLDGNVINLNEQ
jgi:hypothetical protein